MEKLVRSVFIPYCYRSMALKPPLQRSINESADEGPIDIEVVYNICNHVLVEEDFAEALAACPAVLDLFTTQMRCVLYQQSRQTQEESERWRRKAAASAKRFNTMAVDLEENIGIEELI